MIKITVAIMMSSTEAKEALTDTAKIKILLSVSAIP